MLWGPLSISCIIPPVSTLFCTGAGTRGDRWYFLLSIKTRCKNVGAWKNVNNAGLTCPMMCLGSKEELRTQSVYSQWYLWRGRINLDDQHHLKKRRGLMPTSHHVSSYFDYLNNDLELKKMFIFHEATGFDNLCKTSWDTTQISSRSCYRKS